LSYEGKRLQKSATTLNKASLFLLVLAAAFVAPAFIPGIGIDFVYFFILALVMFAWFIIKWNSVKSLTSKATKLETIVGVALIAGDYIENFLNHSEVGMLDLIVIFAGAVLIFYGVRSFKLFWVPMAYGFILLAGYQLENIIPGYVALQNWMAGVMASSMRLFGITASVSGHVVYLNSGANVLALNVEGDCTGLQGILAFGMLSTMTVLDIKVRLSRLVPIFAIGFIGAFLINIVRLFMVFITFEYLGVAAGTAVHVYAGYTLFIVWVLAFWSLAFKYMLPKPTITPSSAVTGSPSTKPLPSFS
jgi:exosortase